jgi:hypothetical protein
VCTDTVVSLQGSPCWPNLRIEENEETLALPHDWFSTPTETPVSLCAGDALLDQEAAVPRGSGLYLQGRDHCWNVPSKPIDRLTGLHALCLLYQVIPDLVKDAHEHLPKDPSSCKLGKREELVRVSSSNYGQALESSASLTPHASVYASEAMLPLLTVRLCHMPCL